MSVNVKQALLDPTSVFKSPSDVVNCQEIKKNQKIKILLQWEYDARELEVAEEENMIGTRPGLLYEVLQALNKLGIHPKSKHSPPTKQGGE